MNTKNRYRFIIMAFAAVLLFTFYGCSTSRDGDKIIQDEVVIKGTTTSHATDKGTIVFVSTNNPQVVVEAKEEQTFPSGAVVVLVERALYSQEIGAYGKDSTNVYCLYGTYSDNGIEKKITETDKPVTLTIPNVFSSEYYEFMLGYKEANASDWQYTKLGDDGKAAVAAARCSAGRPSQFVITTRHINYCYTVFGIKQESKKFDDINSITFFADPAKYAVNKNNEYTKDIKVSSLVEAEKTVSMFTASDLKTEITFYTSSSAVSDVLVDGKHASESVSLEKEFNGEYLHRITINSYDVKSLEKSGNLATYSISLGIKGISKTVFPPVSHIKSTVTTDNKVVFAGEGEIKLYTDGEDGPDGFPIEVVMTAPASDTVVPASTSIVLNFSEAIDWSTKAKKLIRISNEQQANISYSANISDDSKALTIKPDKLLSYGSTYSVDVIDGITGIGNSNYVKPVSFKFVTEAGAIANASIKPEIGSKFDRYYIRKPVFMIDFGKSVARLEDVKNSIRVLQGSEVVEYEIAFKDDKCRIASLSFPAELLAGESYTITMTDSVRDTDGLDIGVFDPVSFEIFKDIKVVETTPADDAENVIASNPINIRISDAMTLDISTAKDSFVIKDLVTDTEFPANCAYDEVNKVISLIPQGNLFFNRRYQVFVKDDLSDKQTLQRLGSYSFSFKTADSDYTIAVLSPREGYHQNNTLPFVVFKDNQQMVVDFVRDLMDYNYASSSVSILKDGVADDWQRTWEGNKLVLTPPGGEMTTGSIYKIAMSGVIQASDNSLINPFVPQEFEVALIYGKGRLDNPFKIYEPEDFEAMRVYRSSCFMLMNDIDFSGITDFIPIGNNSEPFTGKMCGDGKTIKNLNITLDEDQFSAGLFAVVNNANIASITLDESCVVTGSIGIDDSNLFSEIFGNPTGGIVAMANGGTIENCINKATIKGYYASGGIVGGTFGTTIKGCCNEGQFVPLNDYDNMFGGIVGAGLITHISDCENKAPLDAGSEDNVQLLSGIAGIIEVGSIVNCINFGNLTAQSNVSGIVYEAYNVTINECKNIGTLTGDYYVCGIVYEADNSKIIECENAGDIFANQIDSWGYIYSSGIAGTVFETSINKCCNKGNITADPNGECVSGIVGYVGNNSSIEYCWNSGVISGGNDIGGIMAKNNDEDNITIKNCYNIGNVSGYNNVGGIAGYLYYLSGGCVNSCYNIADVSGYSYVAGIIGLAQNSYIKLENCYCRGNINRTSGSDDTFAAIGNINNGDCEMDNCFSTTDTKVLDTFLDESSDLLSDSTGSVTSENNYVFNVAQLSSQGYDTVIKGTPWGEGSTWNNETIWNFYSDKLPELKNMPEP